MIAITCGISSAADAPWAIRAAIRTSTFGARPQIAEVAVNSASPIANIRRAAVDVAEAAADDQPGRERQRVARDDELDRAGAGVQVGLHRRDRDVDDEEVQHDHERAGEDDEQRREPGDPGLLRRPRCGGGEGDGGG